MARPISRALDRRIIVLVLALFAASGLPARADNDGKVTFIGSFFVRNTMTGRDDRYTSVTVNYKQALSLISGKSVSAAAFANVADTFRYEKGPGLPLGDATSLRLWAETPAAKAMAEVTPTRVFALDNRTQRYDDITKLAGWSLFQSGDPMVTLSLTNGMDTSLEVRDVSYQVQSELTPIDDFDFLSSGLANAVTGVFDIASGGVSDPIVSGLSMDSAQILRFQGLVYSSPGDPDSEPVGQFAYEITLIQPVPEPASVALLGIGLGAFALGAARRARARSTR